MLQSASAIQLLKEMHLSSRRTDGPPTGVHTVVERECVCRARDRPFPLRVGTVRSNQHRAAAGLDDSTRRREPDCVRRIAIGIGYIANGFVHNVI